MTPEELLRVYDDSYAEQYNARFITAANHGNKEVAERELLQKVLNRAGTGARWLDLACGTGYFLSQFPEVDRTGLDLSPAMLRYAQEKNPAVPLVQGDFRNRDLFPAGSFDVISSMWWAYSYLETFREIEAFVANASYWLKDGGTFFLPIGDYKILAQTWWPVPQDFPYELNPKLKMGGGLRITGLTWSYDDLDGKRHDHLLFPQPPEMVAMMRRHFGFAIEFPYTEYYRAVIASKAPLDDSFVADIVAKYHTKQFEARQRQVQQAQAALEAQQPRGQRGIRGLLRRLLG